MYYKTVTKKLIPFISIVLFMINTNAQTTVNRLNLQKYSGKWFVIASIPTKFDKDWNYITESYHVNDKGDVDVVTTYKKEKTAPEKTVKSKGFPIEQSQNLKWKVQFIWPFKADYLVEELNDDYTYVVVGHPKRKFLYIMNRSGIMGKLQYEEIIKRCAQKGYDISKLRRISQSF